QLCNAHRVSVEGRDWIGGQREDDVLPLDGGSRRFDGVLGERGQIDLTQFEGELSRLNLSEQEKIAHEAQETLCVSLDDRVQLALLLGQLARCRIPRKL